MHLSAKTQYATLALLELAKRHEQPQPVCLKTIANEHAISSQFLVQILQQLKRAGMVKSIRGSSGGYRLAQDPDQISLLDIVTAMESSPQESISSQNPTAQSFFAIWNRITEAHHQRLSETTLDTVCSAMESQQDMYYI